MATFNGGNSMTPPISDDRLADLIAEAKAPLTMHTSRDLVAVLLAEQARRESERCPECNGIPTVRYDLEDGHGFRVAECPTCHGTGKRTAADDWGQKIFTHKHLDPRCVENGCRSQFAAEPELFIPKRGACALSHDLWWCTNCKRGVGTDGPDTAHFKAGSWAFCPKCGVRLDWKAVGIERSDEGFPASEIVEEPQYRKPPTDELLTALRGLLALCEKQWGMLEETAKGGLATMSPPGVKFADLKFVHMSRAAISQYEQKERG